MENEININNLSDYIYEMSPSDASINFLIKNEDNLFIAKLEIHSKNFNKNFNLKSSSLKDLLKELKRLFDIEIFNWRRERNL